MATKKPLVVSSGAITELVTGDTIPPNSLGSGTADLTTYLRGDGTWTTPAGAGAAGTLTGTTLATNVVTSSLTSVGQLNLLTVKGTTASDAPILGAELISGGTWTLGAGWTGDNTVGFTHASGSGTANLTYSFVPTIGARYLIAWTQLVGGGTFSPGFGGTGTGFVQNASSSWCVIAITAGVLAVAPNNLYSGTLVLSIKQIIAVSTPAISVLDSTGTSRLETRTGAVSNPNNTFIGLLSGGYNSQGSLNVGLGNGALQNNFTGRANTAVGYQSLQSNTGNAGSNGASWNSFTGNYNSAVGYRALYLNSTGGDNSAFGFSALQNNTTGSYNSAVGYQALLGNTTGANNSAVGYNSGSAITTGANNVVIGSYTGAAAPISLTGSNFVVLSDGAANVRQTYNASGALAFGAAGTAFGTSGQVLQSNGSAAVPTWATPSSVNIGFLNIPQNIQDISYTLVLSDSGYHIYHSSGASAATYTIPAASSVAFPLGTAINFVNMATTAVTIAITTDTMYLSGTAGTTGSRTLAQYGSATAIKVSGLSSSGVWLISGSGLT